jgi:hypothetical protein
MMHPTVDVPFTNSPDISGLLLLKKLKKKVMFWKDQVKNAQVAFEKAKPESLQQREKQNEENRSKCESFLGDLQNIEI